MRGTGGFRAVCILLLALAIAAADPGLGWAQQAPSPSGPSEAVSERSDDSQTLTIMAAVAATIGSIVYIPFKALAICPGMALAGGVSLALARGETTTAEYLLRVGCTGTYFITPEMVRGQEEFQGSGTR